MSVWRMQCVVLHSEVMTMRINDLNIRINFLHLHIGQKMAFSVYLEDFLHMGVYGGD